MAIDYSEDEFKDKIEPILHRWYGEDAVTREKYLTSPYDMEDTTRRYADFVVRQPMVTLAIEVKDNEEAVYKAAGQAIMYARHFRFGLPVVILPWGEMEQPETKMVASRVQVVPMNPP